MTDASQPARKDFTRTWRYKLGLFMIVVGNLGLIGGGVLLGAMGVLDAAIVGALVVGGEIAFLVSIYVLGADWWGKFRGIFVWEEVRAPRTR